MSDSCLFGRSPVAGAGEGLHRWRLGKDAGFDLLLTIAGAIALGYIPGGPGSTVWIIILLLSAIVIHSLICVPTSLHIWLNQRKSNSQPFGIFLIFMGIFIMAAFNRSG